MKVVIFADLHLTDSLTSVKNTVLDWAVRTAPETGADAAVCIGDMTAAGTAGQTARLLTKLQEMPIPFYSTPGNAELRRSSAGAEALTILPPEDIPVLMLDSSRGEPDTAELAKLAAQPEDRGCLLATHCPPEGWSPTAQAVLADAEKRRAVTEVIAGHTHDDGTRTLRGLDPDKASGGVPMFAVFERLADGQWTRSDVLMCGVDPGEWSPKMRQSFLDNLGISGMSWPVEYLQAAAELGIQVFELRSSAVDNESEDFYQALKNWRQAGGRMLSLHLPELNAAAEKNSDLEYAAALALRIGADRVTLHVPNVTPVEYPVKKTALITEFKRICGALLENNVQIGIENLHTQKGEADENIRHFGCTIAECADWVNTLRKEFDTGLIGFHLDIGHARNNAPYSQTDNISDYYCSNDLPINAFHLHQVRQLPDGNFDNHGPLTGLYDKLISLSGLFMARSGGFFPADTPMILEIRGAGEGLRSYNCLVDLIKSKKVDER